MRRWRRWARSTASHRSTGRSGYSRTRGKWRNSKKESSIPCTRSPRPPRHRHVHRLLRRLDEMDMHDRFHSVGRQLRGVETQPHRRRRPRARRLTRTAPPRPRPRRRSPRPSSPSPSPPRSSTSRDGKAAVSSTAASIALTRWRPCSTIVNGSFKSGYSGSDV